MTVAPELDGPAEVRTRVEARLAEWDRTDAAARFWRHDPTFWPRADPASVATRLGWLDLPALGARIPELTGIASGVRADGFRSVVVLGMGGSSLAPHLFGRTFGATPGHPELSVLDSTHPEAVVGLRDRLDLGRTLFVVSSKSGTTLEPNAFLRYFWREVERSGNAPARQFVAITDPGTPLARLAADRKFRHVVLAPPTVGGRYSALTVFGLLPAALIGVDLVGLLGRAAAQAGASGPTVASSSNPGLTLGAVLGELQRLGRDKVTFVPSPGVAGFPDWTEQLIAESTGKLGTGIVPVADEVAPLAAPFRRDLVLVDLALRSEPDAAREAGMASAAAAGVPVLRYRIDSPLDLGGEFLRWEIGVAAAGAILGIDPFDQPDVEFAKELARDAMKPAAAGRPAPPPRPTVGAAGPLREAIAGWLALARPGDYVALQAFLAPGPDVAAGLESVRRALHDRLGHATTSGFGPRFLHSTGQLHKGGPPSGMFLQLVDRPTGTVEVPELGLTFERIVRAQADGDAAALRQKGRRLLSIDLEGDAVGGLARLAEAIRA
jgi:transaldolase / glucose-6-phosphate isomerase